MALDIGKPPCFAISKFQVPGDFKPSNDPKSLPISPLRPMRPMARALLVHPHYHQVLLGNLAHRRTVTQSSSPSSSPQSPCLHSSLLALPCLPTCLIPNAVSTITRFHITCLLMLQSCPILHTQPTHFALHFHMHVHSHHLSLRG